MYLSSVVGEVLLVTVAKATGALPPPRVGFAQCPASGWGQPGTRGDTFAMVDHDGAEAEARAPERGEALMNLGALGSTIFTDGSCSRSVFGELSWVA